MQIQPFKPQNVQTIIDLWNACLPHHQISLEQLTRVLFCDDNFQQNCILVAEEKQCVVGFCIGIKRIYPFFEKGLQIEQGWILNIAVDVNCRRKGIGSKLLLQMEKQLDCKHLTLCTYSPNYFFAGVDETYSEAIQFFHHHGYMQKEKAYAMEMDLKNYQMPNHIQLEKQEKLEQGYEFAPYHEQETLSFITFLKENFSAGWRYHAMMAIRKHVAEETILLCKFDNKIIAYVQCAIDGDITRYGPFGVASQMRNQGVGSILVHEMWNMMKQSGANNVWFHSTDDAGRRFYERHGMNVRNTLIHYEKEVF